MGSKKGESTSTPVLRGDPYEVLSVSRDSSDQEIKTAYRKLTLKYHPDKNANNPEASELFKEVAYSNTILSNPKKRRQYDSAGFEEEEIKEKIGKIEYDEQCLTTLNMEFKVADFGLARWCFECNTNTKEHAIGSFGSIFSR